MSHFWNNKKLGHDPKSPRMRIMLLMMGFQFITSKNVDIGMSSYDLGRNFEKCLNKIKKRSSQLFTYASMRLKMTQQVIEIG